MKKNQKRHMINILEKEYQQIYEYCHPRNLIISRWITSECINRIQNLMSGSYGK